MKKMENLEDFDKQFIVRYDESNTCMYAFLWLKEEWGFEYGASGLDECNSGWITVSEAFARMKDKHYYFYPEGNFKKTYLAAYRLNEKLGNATDNIIALFLVGKENNRPLEYLNTIGDTVDTKLEYVNRARKIANYLLGYLNENDLTDEDSTFGDKKVLIKSLKLTKEQISRLT